jgi:hypothetical protein
MLPVDKECVIRDVRNYGRQETNEADTADC